MKLDNTWLILGTGMSRVAPCFLSFHFYLHSTSAQIWIQLETGKGANDVMDMDDFGLKKRLVQEYAAKYKPVPLPTLLKE